MYKPGSQAIYDVVEEFGSDILLPDKPKGEEEIDRKKLGAIVFGDPNAMSLLERIVWPHVKAEIIARIEDIKKQQATSSTSTTKTPAGQEEDAESGNDAPATTTTINILQPPIIVLEAAVLLDAGWEDLLDGVWVVRAPQKTAVERLIEYRSFTREDAEKRIEAQNPRRGIGNVEEEVKNGVVTAIIENTGGLEELKKALLDKLNDSNAWK